MTRQWNLIPNTGHRFISKGRTCYKIHIHMPDDTIKHKSLGYLKIGAKAGLKEAIKLRDEIGIEAWTEKLWRRILAEPYIFIRLPHSLEPAIIHKPRPLKHDPDFVETYYVAKWWTYGAKGRVYHSVLGNIRLMGKLAAYNKTKRALTEAYADDIEILSKMNRIPITKAI